MKTCNNCGNKFEYASPISVLHGKFESDPERPTLHKKNSFCTPQCMKKYIDGKQVNKNEYFLGKILLEKLEMCQFCGNFNHPTEYCRQEDLNESFETHQEIDNKTGELTLAKGAMIYVKYGQHVDLLLEKIQFSATMKKLDADIETRVPLVYFWYDEQVCTEILESMQGEQKEIRKYITTSIKPIFIINAQKEPSTFIGYNVKKIVNPQKIFFPFDIRQDNCWWPTNQATTYIQSSSHDSVEINKDYSTLFEYDQEEMPNDEEMKETEEEMGNLTL